MSIEDLLKPRYKVIADYPDNILPVGAVFFDDIESVVITSPNGAISIQSSYLFRDKEKYPHLFKKLEWWEERKPEDLSWIKYLVWNQKSGKKYHFDVIKINHERRIAVWNMQGYGPPLIECEPITKEEYEEYENQKQTA